MNRAALVSVICAVIFLVAGHEMQREGLDSAPVAYLIACAYTVVGLWLSLTERGRR